MLKHTILKMKVMEATIHILIKFRIKKIAMDEILGQSLDFHPSYKKEGLTLLLF